VITIANLATMLGLSLVRFGNRGGSGFAFLMLGVFVIGLVVWALTRPGGNESAKN
jgi:hypothetical protein